ncbi:unnamed protein product [Rhizoctonia solani]|uniref:Uncharacterized protein n=1 Tax=Rhizoctonia solani TaxID=456999 RepID=A0A8H3BWY9_9AGAM|nr:unnamed protein product [Rhizoctonia solani]
MGKPSSSVYSGRYRAALTVLSAITAFLPFLSPPTASFAAILDQIVNGAQEIMNITQVRSSAPTNAAAVHLVVKKSKRRELVDFGNYVGKMISQLVTALQNDRLVRQPEVRENLEELQKIMCTILDHMSRTSSGGWLSLIRRLLFPEEPNIVLMRQRLDDRLRVFQLGTFIELLSRGANPLSSGTANAPELNRTQPPEPPHSPHLSAHSHPLSRGMQVTREIEQPRNILRLSPGSEPHGLLLDAQRARFRHIPVTVASIPSLEPEELIAASLNVDSLRRSLRHHRSLIKKMELATALDSLSVLLARTGRTREALETSQESAELYRSVAEMDHETHHHSL